MTIYKRIAAVLAAIVLGLGGVLVVSSPAAAAPPGGCTNSSVCGYAADQYARNEGYETIPNSGAGVCENVGLPNRWTSVYNNSGRTIKLYKNVNCGNGVWTLASGGSLRNMALYQPSWNDNIESFRFV